VQKVTSKSLVGKSVKECHGDWTGQKVAVMGKCTGRGQRGSEEWFQRKFLQRILKASLTGGSKGVGEKSGTPKSETRTGTYKQQLRHPGNYPDAGHLTIREPKRESKISRGLEWQTAHQRSYSPRMCRLC